MATKQITGVDADGNQVTFTVTDDPAEDASLDSILTQLQSALDVSGATVTVTDDGAFNVTIDAESVGLAQDSSVQSVLSELQGALDVSGATVTTTDDGNFNVTLDAQNAGLAQDSTIADQESYDSLVVGPATDTSFTEAYNAIKVAEGAVDGTLEIVDGTGSTATIPQAHLTGGQILPVTVQQVKSTSSQTLSNVMLLRN